MPTFRDSVRKRLAGFAPASPGWKPGALLPGPKARENKKPRDSRRGVSGASASASAHGLTPRVVPCFTDGLHPLRMRHVTDGRSDSQD